MAAAKHRETRPPNMLFSLYLSDAFGVSETTSACFRTYGLGF
jgi:hypothetical protein